MPEQISGKNSKETPFKWDEIIGSVTGGRENE